MKVNIFSALRADGSALRASMHLPVHIQNCFLWPCTVSAPPFNIPRSAPAACRPRLPLTQQSRRMLDNFPPGCPPLQKKLCTALLSFEHQPLYKETFIVEGTHTHVLWSLICDSMVFHLVPFSPSQVWYYYCSQIPQQTMHAIT